MKRALFCLLLAACSHKSAAIGKACDGTPTSCVSGATCVAKLCLQTCLTTPECGAGQVCNGATCAPVQCTSNSQCPSGQACTDGLCWAFCDKNSLCNGGCCDGNTGQCSDGSENRACGTSGMCDDCSGNASGPLCLPSITCGCHVSSDCPGAQVCANGVCGTNCSPSAPCSSGCCDNGTCVNGTDLTACGDTGASCLDCTSANAGTECVNGTGCGCFDSEADCSTSNEGLLCLGSALCGCQNAVTDCPSLQACGAAGTCTSSCSATQPCNSNGVCDSGTCAAACSNNTNADANGVCPAHCNGSDLNSECTGNYCCDAASDGDCVKGTPDDACAGQSTTDSICVPPDTICL